VTSFPLHVSEKELSKEQRVDGFRRVMQLQPAENEDVHQKNHQEQSDVKTLHKKNIQGESMLLLHLLESLLLDGLRDEEGLYELGQNGMVQHDVDVE
jgi:hypothetical protein